ncbi:MAG: SDR family NAD(P)-dependent oxidoreductase, partial [Pirellulales bacterium]|nr:SDR family NAD(P)-dependent oxidoreductase [Pirellulales bacterium]
MNSPAEKVALVTGAGKRRVGHSIARRLAERGFHMAVHYNRSAQEAQETVDELAAMGVRASAHQADLVNENEVRRLVDETLTAHGRIDVLVTAAAVWERKRLEDVTADDVRRQFDVNALGTFLCCQRVGLAMVEQPDGGAIVTIGDWATERPYPGYAAY